MVIAQLTRQSQIKVFKFFGFEQKCLFGAAQFRINAQVVYSSNYSNPGCSLTNRLEGSLMLNPQY